MEMNEIIRQQMHRILDIVIDTNGFEQRKRDTTGTMPTVFFDYSGHTNALIVELHKDGWVPGVGYDRQWWLRLDEPISEQTLNDIQTALVNALAEKTKADVLRRDIERAERDLADRKKTIAEMKKELKKEEKGEKNG